MAIRQDLSPQPPKLFLILHMYLPHATGAAKTSTSCYSKLASAFSPAIHSDLLARSVLNASLPNGTCRSAYTSFNGSFKLDSMRQ